LHKFDKKPEFSIEKFKIHFSLRKIWKKIADAYKKPNSLFNFFTGLYPGIAFDAYVR
jgi:hypothetical protein